MKIILISILSLFFITPCLSGDPKYPVSEIPVELKENVNAVVRQDQMVFTILSKSQATLHVFEAITIFNPAAKNFATETVGYDKLSKITMFKGSVYDANGTLIKKLKSNEVVDQSAFDGYSLYSDNRLKSADLSQGSYPYTVEFEYEVEYKFLYAIQGSVLIPDEKISVEKSSYLLIFPPALAPRYKMVNLDISPSHNKMSDGTESFLWSFENLKPIKFEPLGPPKIQQVPRILAAPSQFEYEGYSGDMSTWESYGQWEALLNKGRDLLPESTKLKVQELTKDLPTTEQKTKALYEYLQSRTRYVSISLGIGGLQPFEASVVDKVGYGDCKALSNYMVAMLKEAGIKGYYSTIKAGDFQFDLMLDFPSHQGNHVIVAVPNGADTLWLECTSQTNPFGYSGMFTGDRKAFMLTENGGVWVNTPKYPEYKNIQSRSAEVIIDKAGNATAKVKTEYSGLQYENDGLNFILNDQYDLQKKWIMNTTEIPSFDIRAFKFENKKNKIPSAIVSVDLTLNRLATISGKRLILNPNLMNRNSFIPEKVENRKTEIVRNFGYIDYDTIRYKIPEEIYPEFLPEPVQLKSRFGEYESAYTLDQGLVIYTRKLKINKGKYPPETYQEFTDFYKSINRADNVKLVFLTKT